MCLISKIYCIAHYSFLLNSFLKQMLFDCLDASGGDSDNTKKSDFPYVNIELNKTMMNLFFFFTSISVLIMDRMGFWIYNASIA